VIDIIAAASLSVHPYSNAIQRMSGRCVDSGRIDPVAGTLNEEVGDGVSKLTGISRGTVSVAFTRGLEM
jgi:hypothetical protein